jgi:protein-L-isoaspartate O-methyltransferase
MLCTAHHRYGNPGPKQLRTALADYVRGRGTFRTPRVEAASRTVPRHLFLPGVDLKTAYAVRIGRIHARGRAGSRRHCRVWLSMPRA